MCTLKNSEYFTFYSDETADITSIEQPALCAAFDYDNALSEHFVGLIPISKEVGTHLSATNIMEVLERFFVNMDIPIKNARFVLHGYDKCEFWQKNWVITASRTCYSFTEVGWL